MIIQELINYNPFLISEGIATKIKGTIAQPVVVDPVNSYVYPTTCKYVEKVFASVASADWWKNDKSAFLQRKYISADTLVFELWKDGVKIADIVDDTYGTYYSTFAAQPLYKGFVADWRKILIALGVGYYKIKCSRTIIGAADVWVSQCFHLLSYSDKLANGTVRIESYQTGNIMNSVFDYTDLLPDGWYQSFRIEGYFGFKTPVLEQDKYLTQEYEIKQIQDKITREWTLLTKLLPSVIYNQIVYDNILANEILLTDYNVFNTEIYRREKLSPVSFEEIKHYQINRNMRFSIKFVSKKDNNIKTNF